MIQPPPRYTSSDHALDVYETGMPILEDFMGVALPRRSYVVLLKHPDSWPEFVSPHIAWPNALIDADHLYTLIGYDPAYGPIGNTIYHELAHSYWSGLKIPLWLIEGAAEFLEYYVHEKTGWLDLPERRRAVQQELAWRCESSGVSNIHEWNQAAEDLGKGTWPWPSGGLRWCAYPVGEAFLLGLYEILGEEAMSTAMRELYLLQAGRDSALTEGEIYQVFLAHTPPSKEADFQEVYQRLHGNTSFQP